MIIPNKYLAVNWTDGMKVSKEHFVSTEHFVIDNLRDVASISVNAHNFGLLPPLKGSGAVLSDYEVTKTATNQVQIRVSHCQAITPGGVRISISGDGLGNETLTGTINLLSETDIDAGDLLNGTAEHYYVVLVVNPFERVVSGNPDPEEIPIRQPHIRARYDVQLIHVNNVSIEQMGAYHLVIGKIIKNGDDFRKDEDFIPPCSSITSSDKLMSHYQQISKAMDDLQNLSLQIVSKINYKNQKSDIAQNIKITCGTILDFANRHYFYFRNIVHQQPPIYMISTVSSLASHLYTGLQTLPEKQKEELLNYFFEWSDISPVTFLSRLSDVIEINYSHYNSGAHLKFIQQLLSNIVFVWQKLNTLEYIGQHKENIVVKEEVLIQAVKEKKGWSILD